MLAPLIKIPNLLKELAISQDIDPDSLVNDEPSSNLFNHVKGVMQMSKENNQKSSNA